jgi:hypothetical protein
MKYWEIIADNLSKAGWSLGWVSAIDSKGRTIWIADAHCGDGKLTAFLELKAVTRSPPNDDHLILVSSNSVFDSNGL